MFSALYFVVVQRLFILPYQNILLNCNIGFCYCLDRGKLIKVIIDRMFFLKKITKVASINNVFIKFAVISIASDTILFL